MSLNLDIPAAPRLRDTLAAAALLMLVIASGGVGYWIGSGNAPVREVITPAPAVRQHDDSLVLERATPADPAKPPPAPHQIPAGAKRERAVSVTVQSRREDCPPVTVDMSLVQQDGGRRVIASSPDGEVIGGVDIPIETALLPAAPRKWAAGPEIQPLAKGYGVWIDRDFGRLRLGASVRQQQAGGIEPWIRIGINF